MSQLPKITQTLTRYGDTRLIDEWLSRMTDDVPAGGSDNRTRALRQILLSRGLWAVVYGHDASAPESAAEHLCGPGCGITCGEL